MESRATDADRRYAKYVFLDVVGFSRRSAEAQSEIVYHLNEIVGQSLSTYNVRKDENCILIPTGDGMCIAFIGQDLPYDINMQVALSILASLDSHNQTIEKESRQFQVRIGINQNPDILVTDINGRINIAGAGINDASRIMDKADGNQILVGRAVFDALNPSENYAGSFLHFTATVKHNRTIEVYQYVKAHVGLNIDVPSAWRIQLTPVVGYYFAYAIQNRKILLNNRIDGDWIIAIVLLWLFATDSYRQHFSTEVSPHKSLVPKEYISRIFGAGMTFAQAFAYCKRNKNNEGDAGVFVELANFVIGVVEGYQDYFEPGRFPLNFVNELGIEKLKQEWPDIWTEFNLE